MAKEITSQLASFMKKGLVLGKFMPVHLGHLALIKFALDHCDELIIFLCYHSNEPIAGKIRYNWLAEIYKDHPQITVYTYEYDPNELTDSSHSSSEEAMLWANKINRLFPDLNIIFSSENYGDYLAEFLQISHIRFDTNRSIVPVSGTSIREYPFVYWDYLPDIVRPYFVKKIVVLGSESTGKTTLTEKLAKHYNTVFVSEMAREIIGHTNDCTFEDLQLIAKEQANSIIQKLEIANKILIIDTDLNITKSYAQFLFKKELIVPKWIEDANKSDLYFFLETDCSFIQDGTRLNEDERNQLGNFHKNFLLSSEIKFISITGTWEQRFEQACNEIDETFFSVIP